jgi:hypothetical protein
MCSIVWGGVDDDDILIWDRDAEAEEGLLGLKDEKKACGFQTQHRHDLWGRLMWFV